MLGLGAPVERDGIGYSKPDFGLMEGVGRFLPELSDDMAYAVAERLSHYKNTQLGEYADDLDETVAYYKELTKKGEPISFRANKGQLRRDGVLCAYQPDRFFG